MSARLSNISKTLLVFLFIFISGMTSKPSHAEDINGTWRFDYGYDMTFVGSGGSFTGNGGAGSSYTWAITNGTLSGNQVSWKESYNEITYLVDRIGTINGDVMSGTWTSSWGQNGSFMATRIRGGGSGGNNNGGSGTSGGIKRQTAISLFCNRNGVGLSNADCSVSVADKGAPPRQAPTGVVTFNASNGFFPGTGSCTLQQTQYSPGIVSCTAQFAVPAGFPIGAAFPIDATYAGDINFSGSSTNHQLIQAGCVGDQNNPCSGAVALTFANIPQILKNAIAAVAGCGGGTKAKSLPSTLASSLTMGCRINIDSNGDVASMLTSLGLTPSMCLQMADAISNKDANDQTLRALRDMFRKGAGDAGYLDTIKFDPDVMNAELLRIMRQNQNKSKLAPLRGSLRRTVMQARNKRIILKIGSAATDVGNNKQKNVKIKLNSLGKGLVKALKAGGVPSISLSLKMKSERIGAVPKGVKKKVSSVTALDVAL